MLQEKVMNTSRKDDANVKRCVPKRTNEFPEATVTPEGKMASSLRQWGLFLQCIGKHCVKGDDLGWVDNSQKRCMSSIY